MTAVRSAERDGDDMRSDTMRSRTQRSAGACLVEEEDARVRDQLLRDGHPPPLSAGHPALRVQAADEVVLDLRRAADGNSAEDMRPLPCWSE